MSNADNLPAEADFPAENLPDEGNSNLADELSEEEFPAEYNSEDERERQNEIQRKKDQEE